MTEQPIKDKVNAGMRALGVAFDKTMKTVSQPQQPAAPTAEVARAESSQIADALREVAQAIDRLAEAVRSARSGPKAPGE